jgi:hypothetical protein
MEHHQSFSPGLLYSVAPEDFPQLHLNDESHLAGDETYTDVVLTFLKVTATKWGLIRK